MARSNLLGFLSSFYLIKNKLTFCPCRYFVDDVRFAITAAECDFQISADERSGRGLEKPKLA